MTEFERQCYGMTQEAIRKEYMEGLTARDRKSTRLNSSHT